MFFYKNLSDLLLRRERQIVCLCDHWPRTNSLLLAAHDWGRCAAGCPCVRLLSMTDSGRFCLCGFGLYLTTVFWYIWFFADRRRFSWQQIIRKSDFRLLYMKMISHRLLICAGFLCPLDIGTTSLFLRCWGGCVLTRLWRGTCMHVLCALTRCIFRRLRGHCGMLRSRLFRRGGWCCCSLFCGFLNIGAPDLLLRCGRRGALRLLRFWSGPRGICTLPRRFRRMVWLVRLLRLHICGRICGFSTGGMLEHTARNPDSFVDNFTGSCFDLLCRCCFCAVRMVRLLCAVIQLFYKFLYHLALDGGCSLMFRLLVLWPVISLSNIWNGVHLRNVSHGETHLMLNFGIDFVKADTAEIRLTVRPISVKLPQSPP